MKSPWKPLALAAALGFIAPACAQDEAAKVKVSEAAPDFTLKDQNGEERSLKKLLEDKPVAIVFYRSADW